MDHIGRYDFIDSDPKYMEDMENEKKKKIY